LLLSGACATGQPSASLLIPAPGSPLSVVGPGNLKAADLNGDRHPDLIVSSGKERNIRIFLNDGRGRFRPSEPTIRLDFAPGEIALGDLNADGFVDLGIANHDSYSVTLLMGNGKGGFAASPNSPVSTSEAGNPHTHDLVFYDVNEDRKLDLLAVNNDDDNVSVLLGDGRGGFARSEGSPFRVGRGPYPLAIGDVDGDRKPDLLTPNVEGGDVSILAGDGRGRFAPSGLPTLKVGDRGYFIAAEDLDKDGRLDFVISHDDSTRISVWLNKGPQGFHPAPASPLNIDNRAFQVAIVDMDRDSKMDLVAASDTCLTVMLGDGRGNFSAASGSPFPAGRGTWRLAADDFNGDGKLDVACSNLESDSVTILIAR